MRKLGDGFEENMQNVGWRKKEMTCIKKRLRYRGQTEKI